MIDQFRMKLQQPEGTLASSSVLMVPKSASLVLSCCLSAVSTFSCAIGLAALALVAASSPVATVEVWLVFWHPQSHAVRHICIGMHGYIHHISTQIGKIFWMCAQYGTC